MGYVSIVGNHDDVITELGWVFSMIRMCEGVCPVLATCRRSLDSQNVIEDAMRQNDHQHTTATRPSSSHTGGRSESVRLRTNTTSAATSTTVRPPQVDSNNDKEPNDEEAYTESSSGGSSNANAEAAILLAAYREVVGPGLKVM